MPDIVNKVLKFIDYHRYSCLAVLIGVVLLVLVYTPGCESTAPSPLTGKPATADQLVVERDAKIAELMNSQKAKESETRNQINQISQDAQAKITALSTILANSADQVASEMKKVGDSYANAGAIIEKKDATINSIYTTINNSGLANQVPGGALILGTIGTIFGLGATADNKRKNAVIAALKTNQPVQPS